jgi:multisubunit Na+/H+ antiporter MnhC subunit
VEVGGAVDGWRIYWVTFPPNAWNPLPYAPMLTIIVVAIFVIFIIVCAQLNCLIERRREEEDDGEDTRSQ